MCYLTQRRQLVLDSVESLRVVLDLSRISESPYRFCTGDTSPLCALRANHRCGINENIPERVVRRRSIRIHSVTIAAAAPGTASTRATSAMVVLGSHSELPIFLGTSNP
jgi:hypothetical protein